MMCSYLTLDSGSACTLILVSCITYAWSTRTTSHHAAPILQHVVARVARSMLQFKYNKPLPLEFICKQNHNSIEPNMSFPILPIKPVLVEINETHPHALYARAQVDAR